MPRIQALSHWGRCRVGVGAIALVLLANGFARACPFCSNMGKTLVEDIGEASFVAYAKLSDAKLDPNAELGQPDGSTRMQVHRVLKDHAARGGTNDLVLPRFIPAAQTSSVDYLVFADVIDGRIDPYRGMNVDSDRLIDYLAGAVERAEAKPADRLGYFFHYLGDEDTTISADAYKEFAAAPYKDVAAAAKHYDPDKLIGWLRDPATPTYQIGLFGCLLGASGRYSDAEVLYQIVNSPEARPMTGVDGVMGGYCLLDPKKGPQFVLDVLTDPDNDFNFRYAALRTVQFLLAELPSVDRKQLFDQMVKALAMPDFADLVINEFRKHEVWIATDRILALYGADKFDMQVVRRSIIRYALQCPDPKAQAFIAQLRAKDPQLVADVEEILQFEEAQKGAVGTN